MQQTFGEALTAEMAHQDHTFRELSIIFNGSAGGINRWANDLSTPEVKYVPMLMDYLDVDFDEIASMMLMGQMVRWQRRQGLKFTGRSVTNLLNQLRRAKTRNTCSAIWADPSHNHVTGIGRLGDEWAFDGIIAAYSETAFSVRTMGQC